MRLLSGLAALTLAALIAVACGGGDAPAISPPAEPESTARPAARATATVQPTEPPAVATEAPRATPAPTQPQSQPAPVAITAAPNPNPELVGDWRIYSESLYYDAGGGGVMDSSEVVGTHLVLNNDGSWQFGSSSGRWSVAPIDGSEWDRWLVSPYGPTRKIVLQGWNGGTGDGPLDEEPGYLDFVWIIYHVDSPDPSTVYMKFGH